ncbi:hypothetical protein [Pseudomonas protegens]|uniref:hypothetical protein n=1 Tax=Pseudomonas protegens TaxID=380021 RepID=UPI00215F98C3|nr:hypothetical protein [Pseudomonas protegens]UVL69947.1 hypothetical protein LOY23_18000 [Pseudomonas protegens]
MTIRSIDVGEEPNDETGDTLRDGGIIINENFAELDTRTEAAQAKADQGMADAAVAKAKADKGVADAAAAQAKADKGVADAAKAQDAAAAAKAVADAALPRSALGATVAQLVNGKVPVPQLPEFVEPVKGKGLSSNDFTTAEKTKLGSALVTGDYGLGSKGVAAASDDVTGFGGYDETTPGFPTGRKGQVITMIGSGARRTRIMTDHDADILTFQRYTDSWQTPRRVMLASDYGLGSDPRGGRPTDGVGYISDINVLRASGKYIVTPETVGGAGFYGTLEMSWYDPTGWTMLARPLTGGAMATRASINGSVGGWEWYYPTKRYQSDGLTYTNGLLQSIQHGLGAIPTSMQLFAVPIVDQASWSAGIHVLPASGYSIGANGSLIFIKVASTGLTVLDAQTGASANLTPANWRIVIRAAA